MRPANFNFRTGTTTRSSASIRHARVSEKSVLPFDTAESRADDQENRVGASSRAALAYEDKLTQARGAVTADPKRVAQVVKTWVGEDNG